MAVVEQIILDALLKPVARVRAHSGSGTESKKRNNQIIFGQILICLVVVQVLDATNRSKKDC